MVGVRLKYKPVRPPQQITSGRPSIAEPPLILGRASLMLGLSPRRGRIYQLRVGHLAPTKRSKGRQETRCSGTLCDGLGERFQRLDQENLSHLRLADAFLQSSRVRSDPGALSWVSSRPLLKVDRPWLAAIFKTPACRPPMRLQASRWGDGQTTPRIFLAAVTMFFRAGSASSHRRVFSPQSGLIQICSGANRSFALARSLAMSFALGQRGEWIS